MKIIATELKDCYLIEPTVHEDSRGYFFESFHSGKFTAATGLSANFVQDNESKSKQGVIRGLHIQRGDFAQAKLLRVLSGEILDVAVDVRANSPTYGQSIAVRLSSANKKQLYIPKGYLHGFSVLSEEAVVLYKCDAFYDQASEDGVHPLDEALNIDWQIDAENRILSEKDSNAVAFAQFKAFES